MNLSATLLDRYQIALRGAITPRLLSQIAGNTVRNLHDAMVANGQAPSVFQRFVNGERNAPETSIKLDLTANTRGTISYRGSQSLAAAATFALRQAQVRSVRLTGRYSKSWAVVVDGRFVGDPTQITSDAQQVIITNFAPYSERLEQSIGLRGAHFTSRARRKIRAGGGRPEYLVTLNVAEATRQAYQGIRVERRFISLPPMAVMGWNVPYVRKRPPGGAILYPAVIISARAAFN